MYRWIRHTRRRIAECRRSGATFSKRKFEQEATEEAEENKKLFPLSPLPLFALVQFLSVVSYLILRWFGVSRFDLLSQYPLEHLPRRRARQLLHEHDLPRRFELRQPMRPADLAQLLGLGLLSLPQH